MKQVQVIHNPGAGDENHDAENLKTLLEQHGYDCTYVSSKEKGWKDFDRSGDLLVVAGGDGTIRKVARELLEGRLLDKPGAIALLPLGTANNICRSLNISGDAADIISNWDSGRIKGYDIGRVCNVPDHQFFLESLGYGVFPYLMQEMKKLEDNFPEPEQKMQKALEVLHGIVMDYKPRDCELEADGTDHSGKYILAEIMNTRSIGPNLEISPESDPGDGFFEIVTVPEADKEKFAGYIAAKMAGREQPYVFPLFQCKSATIKWDGTHVHLDDDIVKMEKGTTVQVQLRRGLLDFLV
ncbi:MAG TPA: diacylglycerol kinase family protein [Flavisolibacter sp.]